MIGFMLTMVGMLKLLCGQTAEFHHDHRSDRNTVIVCFALFCYKIFDNLCNHTASAVRAVIGGDVYDYRLQL